VPRLVTKAASLIAAASTLLIAPASTAFAQDWTWSVTPYLWGPGIDGSIAIGPLSAEMSIDFGDIVRQLNNAALVRVEGRNDEHGLFVDITYLSLDYDDAKEQTGRSIDLELDSLIVEGAYVYHLSERNAVELGARYWNLESALIPTTGEAAARSVNWMDGFVGFRSVSEIGINWSWLLRVNFGTGGSDLTAGLLVDFRRKLASGNSIDFGFRAIDLDYEKGTGLAALLLDMSLQGLTIGYTFH
jgi:hypothetical protein